MSSEKKVKISDSGVGSERVGIEVRLPVGYAGLDELPIHFANAFILQRTPERDEYILSVGHVAPPLLIGSAEQMREQAKQITSVQAKMIARFGMTEQRLRELADLIVAYLRQKDEGAIK